MQWKMLALLPLLALPLNGLAAEKKVDLTPTAKVAAVKKMKAKDKRTKKMAAKPVAAKHEHWVCPMHDGGESDHAGKCKKCGMDLVKEEI